MAFSLWADNGPLIVVFGSSLLHQLKKKRCQSWTPTDKTFWIRACRRLSPHTGAQTVVQLFYHLTPAGGCFTLIVCLLLCGCQCSLLQFTVYSNHSANVEYVIENSPQHTCLTYHIRYYHHRGNTYMPVNAQAGCCAY